ncbi:MAG: RES family NAD+ phosphorylase [Actinomycetota bacterium]
MSPRLTQLRPAPSLRLIFRAFPFFPESPPTEAGGALHIPRKLQGAGRHDNPTAYGAFYASRVPESVIAEHLKTFVGQLVTDDIFVRGDGFRYALAQIDEDRLASLVDLDDPAVLKERTLRPSKVATQERDLTQEIALAIYEEGGDGFEWWSTIEASWINITLFAERAVPRLDVAEEPEPLTLDHPAVRDAADALGIRLAE